MDISSISASSLLVLKQLSQNKEVKSFLYKIFHKLYKKIFLKDVICIICEDLTRSNLYLDVNDDKYIILNLENIYKSMCSDSENALISNIKLENYDLYSMKYSTFLKDILNAMRNNYKNKTCIVLLSDVKMAEKLHIKNYEVFLMDEQHYLDVFNKCSLNEKKYIGLHRKTHIKNVIFLYSEINQLKDHLERKFK
jgi:hypothetical protein